MKDEVAMFSGRFDRVHVGHVITIQRIAQTCKKVIVVVLDYPEAKYPLAERMSVLTEILDNSKGDYLVVSSPHHFGKITKEQVDDLPPAESYISGNEEVLEHMKTVIPEENCYHQFRYPNYSASKEED